MDMQKNIMDEATVAAILAFAALSNDLPIAVMPPDTEEMVQEIQTLLLPLMPSDEKMLSVVVGLVRVAIAKAKIDS